MDDNVLMQLMISIESDYIGQAIYVSSLCPNRVRGLVFCIQGDLVRARRATWQSYRRTYLQGVGGMKAGKLSWERGERALLKR
jgi:hypothetical protein